MSGTKSSGSQDQASSGQVQDLGASLFENPKAGIWIRKEPAYRGGNTGHCSIMSELDGIKILPHIKLFFKKVYRSPLGGIIHILHKHSPPHAHPTPTLAGNVPRTLPFTSSTWGRNPLHPAQCPKPVFLPKPPNYGPVGEPVSCSGAQKTKCPSSLNHSTQTNLCASVVTPI